MLPSLSLSLSFWRGDLFEIRNFKRCDPYELGWGWKPLQPMTNYESPSFSGGRGRGTGHPNFMNPFEYGKSFIGKLFPKGSGIQTKP